MNRDPLAHPGRNRRAGLRRTRPQFSLWSLLAFTTLCGVLLALASIARKDPLNFLIVSVVVAICALGVFLYAGQLMVLGWILDFLTWLVSPRVRVEHADLDCEVLGAVLVVRLTDIPTADDCRAFERALRRRIAEQHCDVILDFSRIRRLVRNFRRTLVRLTRAVQREAEAQGRPRREVAVLHGDLFPVFDDLDSALRAMAQHEGHGWVVLCAVPPGIRAVSDVW